MTNKALGWKRNRQIHEDVEFPSGAVADLQPVDTQNMIAEDGSIPDTFYATTIEMDQAKEMGNPLSMTGAQAKEFMEMQAYVTRQAAKRAFVSPRIVDGDPNYDNDEISFQDLPPADKQFLWKWLTEGGEPADALRRFRAEQQARSVAAASQMPSVLPASVEVNGSNG
jgi:hypothetical protein